MKDLKKLTEIMQDEPKYRLTQVKQAIFKDLIEDWGQATSLPISLRQRLAEEFPIKIEAEELSSASSKKILLLYPDHTTAESVLITHQEGRNTVCVSSQVGCPLACAFCATGGLGFKRNLTAMEIFEQVLYWQRLLHKSNERVDNVVFMGMGEPFMNYEAVMEAISMLNNKDMLNIGARHISISTAGIVPGIEKLAKEKLQVNLAISLHAPDNELRSSLMPINRRYKIEDVLDAVDKYVAMAGRQVMFEYLLLSGINDSPPQAKRLAKLLDRPLYVVNLLHYNPTGRFKATPKPTILEFQKILQSAGVKTTIRKSFGEDIAAACGQLAAKRLARRKS